MFGCRGLQLVGVVHAAVSSSVWQQREGEGKRREEKRREEKSEEPTVLYCVSELTESYEGNPESALALIYSFTSTHVNLQDAKYLVCVENVLTYIKFNQATLFREMRIIFNP